MTRNRAFTSAFALAVLSLPTWLPACDSGPKNPGDACRLDADACPDPLLCGDPVGGPASDGTAGVCRIPPGGACDSGAAEPYCFGASSECVDDGAGEGKGTCYRYLGEGEACELGAEYETCDPSLECAELASGGRACHLPVEVRGEVFDAATLASIEGAHVIGLDEQSVAVTDIAVSQADGSYVLRVPVPRADDGAPVADVVFTLRASAQDYQTFPGGLRTALPFESTEAIKQEGAWVIDTAITDVALLELPAEERGLPRISGSVLAGAKSAGVLVVAEAADGTGRSAVADKQGVYTIFNVPSGAHSVKGYAAGLQLTPEEVDVAAASLEGIDLDEAAEGLATVTGSVSIVNAPGGSATSVVLVVESTFTASFARGEVPRGLRTPLSGAPNVTGAFSIEGVPAGSYVVLAAFENDGLVRDPDTSIAGTDLVVIDVPAGAADLPLPQSFKITEALPVFGPGAEDPEPVMSAPTLSWGDDSSEDYYEVKVFNAFGALVWETEVPGQSGSGMVSTAYGGPLEPGMYYQFRATSWRQSGMQPAAPISTTEDLRGVFFVP